MILALLLYTMPIDMSLYQIKMATGCEVVITSGYRDKAHNHRVGGAENSFHLTDRARDLVLSDCGIKKWMEYACKYVSVIVYKDHIHVDNRKEKLCLFQNLKVNIKTK